MDHVEATEEKEEKAPESKAVEPSQRVTTRYMTKYEKARILGTRALQLRCGQRPLGALKRTRRASVQWPRCARLSRFRALPSCRAA